MEIKIQSPVIGPKNVWKVEVSYMYGDADGWGSDDYIFREEDKKKLSDFILLLEKCSHAGSQEYSFVPGWDEFFGDEDSVNYKFYGHTDPQNNEYLACIDGYSVYHYDKDGIASSVSITFTENEKKMFKLMSNLTWNKTPSKQEWEQIFRDYKLEDILHDNS